MRSVQKELAVAAALIAALAACQKPRSGAEGGKRPRGATTIALTEDASAESGVALLMPDSAFATPLPELRWTPVDGAAVYDLAVDDSEGCTSPLHTYRTDGTSKTVSFLENGVYYACVTAHDADGETLARNAASFWILAKGVADPAEQNGQGGSGVSLNTPGLIPFPLFQDDWTVKHANHDGHGPRRDGVGAPFTFGVFADPSDGAKLKLVVNDRGNHRVLVFGGVPTRPEALPEVVVGQSGFDMGKHNGGDPVASNTAFADNVHVTVCPDGQLLVTDRGNNRVLVWRQIPRASGEPADLVIGQKDFTSSEPGVGPARLNQPYAAYCMGGKVLVLDRGNYRMLAFNAMPSRNGASADYVVGQPDFQANRPGCAADHFGALSEALYEGGKLYVADGGNHRVLVFDGLPSGKGAKASVALGQPGLRSCKANHGRSVGADTLSGPSSLAFRDGMLAVGDAGNHRIVFYTLPLSSGKDADFVLGQPDMTTARAPEAPEFGSVDAPKGLLFDAGYIWVADHDAKRLAVIPLPF